MRDTVSLFGSQNVFAWLVDDKTKVPICVSTVAKQAPLSMHVNNEIRLSDHDFVKATKHKLTPWQHVKSNHILQKQIQK